MGVGEGGGVAGADASSSPNQGLHCHTGSEAME